MRVALDTNVLAYAEGVGDERRVTLSRRILAEIPQERIVLPAQTLGELYRVLVGKAHREAAAARCWNGATPSRWPTRPPLASSRRWG